MYEVTGHYKHGFRTVQVRAENESEALRIGKHELRVYNLKFNRYVVHIGW